MPFVCVERIAVVLLFLLWYCSSFYFLATSQLMSATGVVVQLMFNKADEVGLVFFGVADTKNDLNKELGGYENVVVSRPIAIVDEDLSKCLEDVPEGTVASDCILIIPKQFVAKLVL
jgi:hypothetical protein